MATIYHDTLRRGGVAATHELLKDGHTSHSLTGAVRRGEVIRIRQGHYGCPELTSDEIEAIRVGGRLTGLSGARSHGIWTPRSSNLVVAVAPWARALRVRTDATTRLASQAPPTRTSVSWRDQNLTGTRRALNPMACLVDIVRTEEPLFAFAAIESALFQRAITTASWQRELAGIPRRRTAMLRHAGRLSESGGESLLRFRLLTLEIAHRQQVKIRRVGRVDFLLSDCLVVEVDGAKFHTDREAFEEDRRRDAMLSAQNYRVLRFSYTQISRRWPEVESAILAAIGRGDHRH
jgi:very-short-patch-repair endonuclease